MSETTTATATSLAYIRPFGNRFDVFAYDAVQERFTLEGSYPTERKANNACKRAQSTWDRYLEDNNLTVNLDGTWQYIGKGC